MIRLRIPILLATFLAALPPGARGSVDPTDTSFVVTVSHNGSGNFGPQTPGTTTAGIQEAINSCVAKGLDLYIQGGWKGPVYSIGDTIHIPPSQDFEIDGGVYVLNWVGPATKDLLVVDSGMDCHFSFGILVYGGLGAALRVRPQGPVPIDGFPVFVDSDVSASSIADPQPFQRGEREGGTGVVFDTSHAAIVHCHFHFTAILNFATCVSTPDGGEGFCHNTFQCNHLHTNADRSTLLSVGNQSVQNTFDVRIGVDQEAQDVCGVSLGGENNALAINTRGGFPCGNDLVLEASAEGNTVHLIQNRTPFDPNRIVTDRAVRPTSRMTWTGGPIPVRTIEKPAGAFEYTQRLYPATGQLQGGRFSSLRKKRAQEAIECNPTSTSELRLGVGDTLAGESSEPFQIQVLSD